MCIVFSSVPASWAVHELLLYFKDALPFLASKPMWWVEPNSCRCPAFSFLLPINVPGGDVTSSPVFSYAWRFQFLATHYMALCFCARWDIQSGLPKPEGFFFVLGWVGFMWSLLLLVAFVFHALLSRLLVGGNWLWSQWSYTEWCYLKGWDSDFFPCMLVNGATFSLNLFPRNIKRRKKKKAGH